MFSTSGTPGEKDHRPVAAAIRPFAIQSWGPVVLKPAERHLRRIRPDHDDAMALQLRRQQTQHERIVVDQADARRAAHVASSARDSPTACVRTVAQATSSRRRDRAPRRTQIQPRQSGRRPSSPMHQR